MRSMIVLGMSLTTVVVLGSTRAEAQDMVKDPAEITYCLCERQTLASLLDAVHQRQQRYDTSRQTLATLDQELTTRRSQMNVYDHAQVEAYKQLLERHDHEATVLANDVAPDYNTVVGRYNTAFTAYNARCAGKSFDQPIYKRVEATLSCPKP
jgi:deoxyribodipyrimidine photolyase